MHRHPMAVAIVATLWLCGGCGTGQNARHGRHPGRVHPSAGSGASPAPGPYRWLVALPIRPPSVPAENRHPGTAAWRLPGPPEQVGGLAHGDVSGYVAEQAVSPGQIERVYVSAPGQRAVRIRVFRMGWYGGAGGREVLISNRLPLRTQPPCAHDFRTGLTRCHWHPTLSFTIPPGLPSGVYIAKLSTARGASDCLFVVRATRTPALLAQLPTSTYEAYNAWGGDSLYPGGADRVSITGSTQGVEVSYDRPYDSVTGAGQFFARDVALVRFLERYGYPVAYTTSESVDSEPGQLQGVRAVLDFGHSEYWSEGQAGAFARAGRSGASLLFLSSDTLAWRIRYAAGDHVIVAYKEHASLDPDRSAPTGAFPGGGASLTGSAYLGCITPRLRQAGPPVYRYYEWRPSPGLVPKWLFAGTGITAATRIPGIVGYELDMKTADSPPGARVIGGGEAPCMTPAPGEPAPGPGQTLGQTVLSTGRSGSIVFSSGTMGWELGLEPVPSASPDAPRAPDPRIVRLTRNLLGRALGWSG